MKYVQEYRNPKFVKDLAKRIREITTRNWSIMEVCGGQTHSILKFGIDQLIPERIRLIHGPGCPVCVTPASIIDKALAIGRLDNVILCTFGDMVRVPGINDNLLQAKASGSDIRVIYSPIDCLQIARENPDKKVVFFAIGFETTAPANAMAVFQSEKLKLSNFSILPAQVLIPPAIEKLLSDENCRIDGILAPGHVCTIIGLKDYKRISRRFNIPIVITGFEPVDILDGFYHVVSQLEDNQACVENRYSRSVRDEGNPEALRIIDEVFDVADREWRGIGMIPKSGLKLNERYAHYDAEQRFDVDSAVDEADSECISGLVLQGVMKPTECSSFGRECTPEHPLGATMVSSEGACAAYYLYKRNSK
ncbi:MAG: hydrogenase formation protein HypD [candidate division Zixibacteria bacterium]|nr:hydrogenase formation protein HypD [candidate division Zixibacteria bacterium]